MHQFKYAVLLLLVAAGGAVQGDSKIPADTDSPQSPAAVAAKKAYVTRTKELRQTYLAELVKTDQAYVDALAAAEDTAMKEGLSGKAEADKIEADRLAAIDTLKMHQQLIKGIQQFRVEATAAWRPVAMVTAGTTYTINASGKWLSSAGTSCGPDGDVNGHGFLEAHIAKEVPFKVGTSTTFVATESGPLYMQMRDMNHSHNSGYVDVTLTPE